jgi:chromosomal replication initiator protein
MQILNEYWSRVLDVIKPEMTDISFNTWIKTLEPISIENDNIVLKASSIFQKNTVTSRYLDLIKAGFKHVTNKDYNINILLESESITDKEAENVSNIKDGYSNKILNPKYTFDSFVIGDSNRFAHAAALASAESLGKAYNPLFLYGGVGLRKNSLNACYW